jgi:hypothetical protein
MGEKLRLIWLLKMAADARITRMSEHADEDIYTAKETQKHGG